MRKKRQRILSLLFVLGFIFLYTPISASSGKLKSASIISCNGNSYGNHGDGHWHKAVKHDAGWYPDGDNLGYDNPCSTTSTPAPAETKKPQTQTPVPDTGNSNANSNTQQKEQQRIDKEKQEAQRKENERIEKEKQEAQRIENERIEKEKQEADRIEKERLEKIRLEQEALEKKLNNVNFIGSEINGVRVGISSKPIQLHDVSDVTLKLENEAATYTWDYENKLEPFKMNTVKVTIESENKEKKREVPFQIFLLGTQDALYSVSDLAFKQGDQTLEYNDQTLTLTSDDITSIKMFVGDTEIETDSIESVNQEDGKYVRFTVKGTNYDFKVADKPSNGLLTAGISGGVLLGTGYVISKKLKSKKHSL